ncbi:hypothetical protein ACFLS4_03300 [Bacteroidota bacterium]
MTRLISLLLIAISFSGCNIWMNCKCEMKYKTIENRVMNKYEDESVFGLYETILEEVYDSDTLNYRLTISANNDTVQRIFLELGEYGYAAYTTTNRKNKTIDRLKKNKRFFKKCGYYAITDDCEFKLYLESKESKEKINLNGNYNYQLNAIEISEIIYRPDDSAEKDTLSPDHVFMLQNDMLVFKQMTKNGNAIKTYEEFIQQNRKKK